MKSKTAINIAFVMCILNIVYFVVYNSLFGWNLEPVSDMEKVCDAIFSAIVRIAALMYILPLFKHYMSLISKGKI